MNRAFSAGDLRPAGRRCAPDLRQSLLARHLRFHRHLLALWRHTAALPDAADPAAWTTWIERRQLLLDRLHASDAPRVVADTNVILRSSPDHPLSPVLRTLQQRELSLMQSLLSLECTVLRLLSGRRLALARRLRSAQRAGAACSAYRRRDLPAPRRRSRAKPPLTG